MAPGPLLLLRVDVSREHGTGHLMRCKALGDAWQRAGGQVEYATASDLTPYAAWLGPWPAQRLSGGAGETLAHALAREAAWVAADGYHFDAAWQEPFAGRQRLLLFDDYGHGAPHSADLVLNQNPGASERLYAQRREGTSLLLGPRFALLREQFKPFLGWTREIPPRAERLLVTFGGTDPAGMTLVAVRALLGLPLTAEVVVGAGNPHAAELEALCAWSGFHVRRNVLDMPELMASCDFALGAAGTTTLESAFLQLPQLLVTVADNQLLLAEGLAESGAAELLGWHTEVSPEQIRQAVSQLASNATRRAAMGAAAARLVDGAGAERVVAHLRARSLQLRDVEESDARRLWDWANDPATRAASFNSTPIPWPEHQAWLRRQMGDPDAVLQIGEDSAPIGLVRFALSGEEADISIVLAPEARGRGLAAPLILRGSHALLRAGRTQVIHAYIKPENKASRAAFLRAGYRPVGTAEVHGHLAGHFALEAGEVPPYERA